MARSKTHRGQGPGGGENRMGDIPAKAIEPRERFTGLTTHPVVPARQTKPPTAARRARERPCTACAAFPNSAGAPPAKQPSTGPAVKAQRALRRTDDAVECLPRDAEIASVEVDDVQAAAVRPIRTLPVRPSPCRNPCGRPRSSARPVPPVARYLRRPNGPYRPTFVHSLLLSSGTLQRLVKRQPALFPPLPRAGSCAASTD